MSKCCVCGREATVTAHGLSWCEKHSDFVKMKNDETNIKKSNQTGDAKTNFDLGLKKLDSTDKIET